MSERKVLNKYYPPDFDPAKIPRMKLPKNRQYTVRLMAPFNMRCATCGEYIYKGKKFNARKEDVEDEDYLGIRIYRFYIKCTRCLQEISFRTDPKTTDYEIEAGAIRNFMALKKAEEQAKREEEEVKESEANNPMKLLENRTEQSKQEMELVEALEELRELNVRQGNVDYDAMLKKYNTEDRKILLQALQDKEDEKMIKQIFGPKKRVVEEVGEEVTDDFTDDAVMSKKIKLKHDTSETANDRITFAGSSIPLTQSSTTSAFKQNVNSFIRKKDPATSSVPSATSTSISTSSSTVSTTSVSLPVVSTNSDSTPSVQKEVTPKLAGTGSQKETPSVKIETESQGLSLLGAYSSSEGSEEES